MKKTLILPIFSPSAALAHVGDHSGGIAQSLAHALTQPDHILAVLGVLGMVYAIYRWRKG